MRRGDELTAESPATAYPSFAALGDSFTEGLDDPYPDRAGYRGWADRVAGWLAELGGAPAGLGRPDAHAGPLSISRVPPTAELHSPAGTEPLPDPGGFRYANLAVRGRRLPEIVAQQVPAAIALRPVLVSLAGGTNDALRRHFDAGALEAALRSAVEQLTGNGCRVLLFTGTDPTRRLPAIRGLVPRIAALNESAQTVAAEYGCLLVDLWPMAAIFDHPSMWSADRLHLSGEGHRRVAGAVLETLGVPSGEDWRASPGAAASVSWRNARTSDARWVRAYFGPWLHRRITGRSSGDAAEPKRPYLEPYGDRPRGQPGSADLNPEKWSDRAG